MNTEIFNRILDRNSISSDRFAVYYNFSNISGNVIVFNELYPYYSQYRDGKLLIQNNPGVIVGYQPSGFDDYLGSGYFQGDTILRIGKNINFNDWTIFINAKNSGCFINKNLPTILVSNKKNTSDESGFCFGINGANKFFIENTISGETATRTTQMQGYQSNCISLAKVNNKIQISLHDILNEINLTEEFAFDNYRFSNEWFLGNTYDFENTNYTGFIGYFDDFILLSGFISPDKRKNLAKSIFYSGYIPPQTVLKTINYQIYSSTQFNQTGIIGVGTTGYADVDIGEIPAKDGYIDIYEYSSLTGFLYGETIELIPSGENSGVLQVPQFLPEQFILDAKLAEIYSSNYIKFTNPVDEKDLLEIYNFENPSNTNKTLTTYDFTTNSIFLDSPYTGQEINLYLNGLLQQSTTGSLEVENNSGDYYISFPQNIYSNNFYELIPKDKVIYYKDFDVDFYVNYVGDSNPISVVTGDILYLNGQKLISGINYVRSGINIYINTGNTLATGEINITNDLNNYLSYKSGFGLPPFLDINYVNEKVFLNGVLQELNVDYKKYSCLSLLTGNFIKSIDNNYIIYNNDTGFFNY